MGANSKIEWTDHTFNPWIGCTAISPACDHCYAEARMDTRLHVVKWGAGEPRKRTSEKNWREPLKWNAEAAENGVRYRVFCASLADVFDNDVPTQWRIDLIALILATPDLDWLLLTKRIGNAAQMLETAFRAVHHQREGWADNVPRNVWIGATICNQEEAVRDIPKLLKVPAAKRFLSMEPLLGPVSFEGVWVDHPNPAMHQNMLEVLDWVIVGGESGHGARPMHPDWVRLLRDQCNHAGVAFHFKQWGEWAPREPYASEWMESDELCGKWDGTMYRFGKKQAGRELDGRTWDELPT